MSTSSAKTVKREFIATPESIREAEDKSLRARVDGDFYVHSDAVTISNMDEQIFKNLNQHYYSLILRIMRLEIMPPTIKNWTSAVNEFFRFVLGAVDDTISKMLRDISRGTPNVGVIPLLVFCPHPTQEENDTFVARWNDDGDMSKLFMRKVKKLTDKTIKIYPSTIYMDDTDSPVMFALVLLPLVPIVPDADPSDPSGV